MDRNKSDRLNGLDGCEGRCSALTLLNMLLSHTLHVTRGRWKLSECEDASKYIWNYTEEHFLLLCLLLDALLCGAWFIRRFQRKTTRISFNRKQFSVWDHNLLKRLALAFHLQRLARRKQIPRSHELNLCSTFLSFKSTAHREIKQK